MIKIISIMKKKTIKKIALGILVLIITTLFVEVFYTFYNIKKQRGGFTEVINPSSLVDKYNLIGIKNVNVLSEDCSHFAKKNIVLKEGLIHSIDSINVINKEIEYINGSGKFLIPGLIDTHVHLSESKNDLYLFLVNGVTSIYEMFGTNINLKWKEEIINGGIGPNIKVASSKLGSQDGLYNSVSKYFHGPIHVTTVDQAKKAVKDLKEEGYDAIKLGSLLKPEIYAAIIKEAKNQNLPAIGHLSYQVGLNKLYTSGQSELAHVEEITKATMEDFGGLGYDNTNEYLAYLNEQVDSISIKLKENNISVSTTIWLMESLPKQKFELDNFINTIKIQYVNPGILEGSALSKGWLPGNNHYENLDIKNDSIIVQKSKLFWDTYIKAIHIVVKSLRKHNVTILAGTDNNVAGVVSGFSMHDEMKSLSNTGMTNQQVLISATKSGGEFIKLKAGIIREGYKADLILLSKNPLDNIENTKSIEKVFFGNYQINKTQREGILKNIEGFNNKNRNVEIKQYLN